MPRRITTATRRRFFRHGELPLVILLLLDRTAMNGYQLLAELERLFGDAYVPSTGTIYPAMTALEEEGLISAAREGNRSVHRVTAGGHKVLRANAEKLAELEVRTGVRVRMHDDVMASLERFNAVVRSVALRVEPETIRGVLEDAAQRLTEEAPRSEARLERSR